MKNSTTEQPLRAVLVRWREAGVLWAELECEHQVPCTSRPIAKALRCSECLPEKKIP